VDGERSTSRGDPQDGLDAVTHGFRSSFRDWSGESGQPRPIFHQVQRRVESHIFLCVLAYHLLVAIKKTLVDQGVHSSWASVRDALATHHIVTIVLPTDSGATMLIRKASTAESEHRELYRLLGVDEKIMSPKTIWRKTGDPE